MDGWMDGWREGRREGGREGGWEGWMHGWMDGWTNGWMDGWKDGWTDSVLYCVICPSDAAMSKPAKFLKIFYSNDELRVLANFASVAGQRWAD